MKHVNPLLDAALDYAARRWSVFPCSPQTKRPLTAHGFKDATTDVEQITAWWSKCPTALIGVPTGHNIGSFVLDFDAGADDKTGAIFELADRVSALEHEIGECLPPTLTVTTPRGGEHRYFALPPPPHGSEPYPMPGTRTGVVPRVDVRGEGGYVIVPPSARVDGKLYVWETPVEGAADRSALITPAPRALLYMILRRGRRWERDGSISKRAVAVSPSPGGAAHFAAEAVRKWAISALVDEAAAVAGASKGGRNHRLNVAAFSLGQLVGAGALSESFVRATLEDAAVQSGLAKDDGIMSVRRTIDSGLRHGVAKPRDLRHLNLKVEERPAHNSRRQHSGLLTGRERDHSAQNDAPFGDDAAKQSSVVKPTSTPTNDRQGFEPRPNGFDIDELNSQYAFVLVGSKALIFVEHAAGVIEDHRRMLAVEAFKGWFLNTTTECPDASGSTKRKSWADAWLQHPKRRQYRGVEFFPDPNNAPGTPGYLNLWSGLAVKPTTPGGPGTYKIFRDHLVNNVCHGDQELFNWVFGFFAHIVQRPRERIGVALVMRGRMGSGKTKVGEVIGSLFPPHYLLVDDPRYVTGQFNAHMATCLLLQADEALWAGDKAAEGRLKGLITSSVQQIERKGIDPIQLANYVRVIMTSNEDWVVPAGKDERRFCVLDVDPRCAQNHDYFGEMDEELSSGGREKLLADLLSFDLSTVNLRKIPLTTALLEQKILSLGPIDAWWLERLMAGTTTRRSSQWDTLIPCSELIDDYIETAERMGIRRKQAETAVGMKLAKIAPGSKRDRLQWPVKDEDGKTVMKRTWCYVFPPLSQVRESFEDSCGQSIPWPQDDSDERNETGEGEVSF